MMEPMSEVDAADQGAGGQPLWWRVSSSVFLVGAGVLAGLWSPSVWVTAAVLLVEARCCWSRHGGSGGGRSPPSLASVRIPRQCAKNDSKSRWTCRFSHTRGRGWPKPRASRNPPRLPDRVVQLVDLEVDEQFRGDAL